MRVDLIASTSIGDLPLWDAYGYDFFAEDNPTEADGLAEAAGRLCYKSFNRPSPKTRTNAGYLANILAQGHYSVLEHASASFLVRDVSRALLAELSRHRHLSFSVVSQRYCDYSETKPVIPPALAQDHVGDWEIHNAYHQAIEAYESLVTHLVGKGLKRKAAREAARCVLPNAAPVDMVVTGNFRAWRDVLGKRWSVHADAEIQEYAGRTLEILRGIAPNSFQDIPEEPYK
ncbi:ThyX-like thymidylate synthase [Streptomyces phage Sycamore]|uniref:ThyX-like thymidylate synthase n=1 Tax=Streptomyces phage Sycamore TaxID=2767589 RepID=A0A873WDW6_9CAUD|nr:ThyX-like thymidylate synthase [Streptomyces phage Sycamore]